MFEKEAYFYKKQPKNMVKTLEKPKLYSVEEYFELENNSDIRHEYYYGKLIAMPGESKNANRLARKFERALYKFLDEKLFEVFRNDVRLVVNKGNIYRYPDLTVALVADDEDDYVIKMPIVLVEILSDSTEKIDFYKKLTEYTAINSAQQYILVAQKEVLVSVFRRENDEWKFDVYNKLQDKISLPSIGGTISLSEIYEGIILENTNV